VLLYVRIGWKKCGGLSDCVRRIEITSSFQLLAALHFQLSSVVEACSS